MELEDFCKARAAAQQIKCKSNLKQWGLYIALYANDYDSRAGFFTVDRIGLVGCKSPMVYCYRGGSPF